MWQRWTPCALSLLVVDRGEWEGVVLHGQMLIVPGFTLAQRLVNGRFKIYLARATRTPLTATWRAAPASTLPSPDSAQRQPS